MEIQKLKVGIVGLGRAARYMIPTFIADPRIQIVSAADINPKSRESFEESFKLKTYSDFETMFLSEKLDCVYIATPHEYHMPIAISALNFGINVLVEKPMALTLQDCQRMIEVAERNKVVLMVGHTAGYNRSVKKMSDIIDSGKVGKVGMVHAWNYTDFIYRYRRPEELDTSRGGGVLFNQLPHQVDMVRLVAGKDVRSVRAWTAVLDSSRPTEGAVTLFLDFADNVSGTIVYSGYDHFDSDEWMGWVSESGEEKQKRRAGSTRRQLIGISPEEEASLKSSSGVVAGINLVASNAQHAPHFGLMIASCEKADLRLSRDGLVIYGNDGNIDIKLNTKLVVPDRSDVIDELYDAITGVKAPIHSGKWGLATLEIVLAAMESAQNHREIELHYQLI